MSRALDDAGTLDDDTELRILNNLGLVHLELGQMEAASERLSRALAVAESRDFTTAAHRARVLANLGVVSLERAQLDRARDEFRRAFAAAREANLPYNEKMSLDNLGEVHRELGELDAAGDYFGAAAALSRRLESRHLEAASLTGVAGGPRCRRWPA
jgi:tetratricopeptide (TPR) repeat protein